MIQSTSHLLKIEIKTETNTKIENMTFKNGENDTQNTQSNML